MRLPSRREGANVRVVPDQTNEEDKKASKKLPVISAAPQQQPAKTFEASRNPLALRASESRATAMRNNEQEKWRSALLECEVALKELVTNSIDEAPTESRVIRVFRIFDEVSLIVQDISPDLAQLLKMFRMEFCRAIFPRQSVEGAELLPWDNRYDENENLDGMGMTYFDRMDALLRENAVLHVEVDLGNTRENLVQLRKQVAKLMDMVSSYENEVSRLERENERSAESYRKAKEELAEETRLNHQMAEKFSDDKRQLLQECKDMQLQLCRLRKFINDRESKVIEDTYMYMKTKKMGVMTRLFDEGDERVSILVIISQLESRVNESLDKYDKEMLLYGDAGQPLLREQMVKKVSVLLEEIHLCEERYMRLLPPRSSTAVEETDATDGFVSLLSDPRSYKALVSKLEAHGKKGSHAAAAAAAASAEDAEVEIGSRAQTLSGSERKPDDLAATRIGTPTVELKPKVKENTGAVSVQVVPARQRDTESQTSQVVFALTEEQQEEARLSEKKEQLSKLEARIKEEEAFAEMCLFVKEKQEEWVANIFGTAVETAELLKRVCERASGTQHVTTHEQLMQYFISHPMLDVSSNKFHCGIDIYAGPAPLTQAFLCSVMDVDPVAPLHLPQGTNYMHIKYRNPLRQESVRDDAEAAVNVAAVMASDALDGWGGRTCYVQEGQLPLPELVNNSNVFTKLKQSSAATNTIAASSSTPTAIAFERLDPLSPNRSPEWLLYQSMFGGYRPLTPRLIDISYIDHILLNSCESHFFRAEERYMRCWKQARSRATNSQMTYNMAERFFKDSYALTDFQESIVRELESRYCYPELVAKTLYEILCFLDASASSQPLVDLYLSCIRGFESPTRIHYITYVMYQLTTNWPSSNPEESVGKNDVLTLLEYIYRRAFRVASVDVGEMLTEFLMSTRSAPITLNSLRNYLVTAMLHYEDPLLLYFNGLLSYRATSSSVVEMNYDMFESALKERVEEKSEGKTLIRYLTAACGFNKKSELTTKELACVATSMWSSKLWANM